MARLLVIEDERKLLRTLQRGLETKGYEVAVAATGEEGQTRLVEGGFDCVILDWMLPARDGVEDRVRGLDRGADDYLVKPFAFAELLARLRALLRRGPIEREIAL